MRGELTVRVDDGVTDRHVTRQVRGLRFTKTAPGGHHSASCRLLLPRDTFRNLGPADRLYVYDSRSGRTVWEGYTENPGVTDGPEGEEYDLSAMGGMVLASDESRALVYVDRHFSVWNRDEEGGVAAGSTTSASTDPTNTLGDGLLCQFPAGQPITTDYRAQIAYHALDAAGMEFGALYVTTKSGKSDADYRTELAWSGGYAALASSTGTTTTAITNGRYVGAGAEHPPVGVSRIALRLRRTGGATNIADDNTWSLFAQVAVLGRRMDRHGALVVSTGGMKSNEYVRADWVVEDLLGRSLKLCDPAAAVIDAASFQIDQLAYHDGATAQRVFDDLSLYEPDFLWEILETTATGKHKFNYRKWPTTARYEISTSDGYQAPGGEVDLCNRVTVYWTDGRGRKQATQVTAYVEELGGDPATPGFTGRVRDADAVTLPDWLGSAANAARIGQQVLAAKNKPPKAARAVVRRPIVDHLTGATVMPWEIEPGYLVRVRETGDDLRLTEMEYVDEDASATLTLGEPTRTLDQLISGLRTR